MIARLLLTALALALSAPAVAQVVTKIADAPKGLKPLPYRTSGRTLAAGPGEVLRQWPGTYFEAGLTGETALFRVGAGKVSLRIRVDDGAPVALVRPEPGIYRVSGLGAGQHRLRIDVVSESQTEPTGFGGFLATAGTRPAPLPSRSRAIEFVGDSHTVGYGNTSATRQCTEDEVWATTDTSQGVAALMARRYDAEYQVNAISGRGIVRNYNGGKARTLPEAYPFALLAGQDQARLRDWHPQVIVISLGTNDFSTPLNPGETWQTRDALHADYEATFVRFVGQIRARNPQAYLLFWATDLGGKEIETEVGKVVDQLHRSGDMRTGFVPMDGLAFSGCHSHPGLADDQAIADALARHLDGVGNVWAKR